MRWLWCAAVGLAYAGFMRADQRSVSMQTLHSLGVAVLYSVLCQEMEVDGRAKGNYAGHRHCVGEAIT